MEVAMKRYILVSLVLCSFLALSGLAWADVFVGSTNVGSIDTLKGSAFFDNGCAANDVTCIKNSGDQTEINWVNLVLGATFSTSDMLKYDATSSLLQTTDTNGVLALQLQDDPSFFLVKTGGKGDTVYLFQNNIATDWAVLALGDFDPLALTGGNPTLIKLSHIDETGGGDHKVSEPGMLMLFGTGLLGLGLFGRKKFRK
jgi:hypothetical protein